VITAAAIANRTGMSRMSMSRASRARTCRKMVYMEGVLKCKPVYRLKVLHCKP